MAEFLIKAVSAANPDPAKDLMCYKRGDIVVVMPDGHPWGSGERDINKFLIVQVPDMSREEARLLCCPVVGMDILTGNEIVTTRRRFFCAENIKPENMDYFNQCVADGVPYITTRLDFLTYSVEDKL